MIFSLNWQDLYNVQITEIHLCFPGSPNNSFVGLSADADEKCCCVPTSLLWTVVEQPEVVH